MAQDYARKSATRSNQRSPAVEKSSTPAFFAGLVIGALLSYFAPMLFEGQAPGTLTTASGEDKTKSPDLTFTFHEILKNSKIVIPEGEQVEDSKAVNGKDYNYLLQVGSFRNKADAEGLRVQLLLLNLTASTETLGADKDDIWHRVLVGPFANTSKMASARAKLAQNDIDSLLLKRKL